MSQDLDLTSHARHMRLNPTLAEARLWSALRGRQTSVKFRRQMPLGRYIGDFVCLSHRLIVEVDGSHHGDASDRGRDQWLEGQGFQILRFSNDEVLHRLDGVLMTIGRALALT
jgi:very-short-patch-repair endonuclease